MWFKSLLFYRVYMGCNSHMNPCIYFKIHFNFIDTLFSSPPDMFPYKMHLLTTGVKSVHWTVIWWIFTICCLVSLKACAIISNKLFVCPHSGRDSLLFCRYCFLCMVRKMLSRIAFDAFHSKPLKRIIGQTMASEVSFK